MFILNESKFTFILLSFRQMLETSKIVLLKRFCINKERLKDQQSIDLQSIKF